MKTLISVISVIGALIVLEGVVFLIKPQLLKPLLKFFAKGKNIYIPAVLRVIFGVVFIYFAQNLRVWWMILIIGILLCAAGVAMFMVKIDKLKAMLGWWEQRSLITLRLMAVVAMIVGGIIFYAGSPQ